METVNLIEGDSLPQPLGELRGAAERLDACDATLAPMAQPEAKTMRVACQKMGELLIQLQNWVAESARRRRGMESAQNAEMRAIDMSLMGPNEKRARQQEAVTRYRDDAVRRTVAIYTNEGQRRASEIVDRLKQGKNQLDSALAKAVGPLSLSAKMSVDRAVRIASLKEELGRQSPANWQHLIEGLVARSERDAEIDATLAFAPLAQVAVASAPPTLAKQFGELDSTKIRQLRTEGASLLAFLERRRQDLVPAYLHTLSTVNEFLISCFWWILSFSPTWMSSQELAAAFANGPKRSSDLEVAPNWIERYLKAAMP